MVDDLNQRVRAILEGPSEDIAHLRVYVSGRSSAATTTSRVTRFTSLSNDGTQTASSLPTKGTDFDLGNASSSSITRSLPSSEIGSPPSSAARLLYSSVTQRSQDIGSTMETGRNDSTMNESERCSSSATRYSPLESMQLPPSRRAIFEEKRQFSTGAECSPVEMKQPSPISGFHATPLVIRGPHVRSERCSSSATRYSPLESMQLPPSRRAIFEEKRQFSTGAECSPVEMKQPSPISGFHATPLVIRGPHVRSERCSSSATRYSPLESMQLPPSRRAIFEEKRQFSTGAECSPVEMKQPSPISGFHATPLVIRGPHVRSERCSSSATRYSPLESMQLPPSRRAIFEEKRQFSTGAECSPVEMKQPSPISGFHATPLVIRGPHVRSRCLPSWKIGSAPISVGRSVRCSDVVTTSPTTAGSSSYETWQWSSSVTSHASGDEPWKGSSPKSDLGKSLAKTSLSLITRSNESTSLAVESEHKQARTASQPPSPDLSSTANVKLEKSRNLPVDMKQISQLADLELQSLLSSMTEPAVVQDNAHLSPSLKRSEDLQFEQLAFAVSAKSSSPKVESTNQPPRAVDADNECTFPSLSNESTINCQAKLSSNSREIESSGIKDESTVVSRSLTVGAQKAPVPPKRHFITDSSQMTASNVEKTYVVKETSPHVPQHVRCMQVNQQTERLTLNALNNVVKETVSAGRVPVSFSTCRTAAVDDAEFPAERDTSSLPAGVRDACENLLTPAERYNYSSLSRTREMDGNDVAHPRVEGLTVKSSIHTVAVTGEEQPISTTGKIFVGSGVNASPVPLPRASQLSESKLFDFTGPFTSEGVERVETGLTTKPFWVSASSASERITERNLIGTTSLESPPAVNMAPADVILQTLPENDKSAINPTLNNSAGKDEQFRETSLSGLSSQRFKNPCLPACAVSSGKGIRPHGEEPNADSSCHSKRGEIGLSSLKAKPSMSESGSLPASKHPTYKPVAKDMRQLSSLIQGTMTKPSCASQTKQPSSALTSNIVDDSSSPPPTAVHDREITKAPYSSTTNLSVLTVEEHMLPSELRTSELDVGRVAPSRFSTINEQAMNACTAFSTEPQHMPPSTSNRSSGYDQQFTAQNQSGSLGVKHSSLSSSETSTERSRTKKCTSINIQRLSSIDEQCLSSSASTAVATRKLEKPSSLRFYATYTRHISPPPVLNSEQVLPSLTRSLSPTGGEGNEDSPYGCHTDMIESRIRNLQGQVNRDFRTDNRTTTNSIVFCKLLLLRAICTAFHLKELQTCVIQRSLDVSNVSKI
ncbi:hypothetical protein Tcan_14543 [Toxocara canis]|uniref:Uncharacterized protein n=1 Tax=Toxocara canis TaxID=6265 RepID=A0A0B2W5E1_TOXCA|nr:hypothetical protein Tcan_14543 [Toxocara canis]